MADSEANAPLLGSSFASPASSSVTLSSATEKSAIGPQNTLTRKFTQREWNALSSFRARLPDVFIAAYGPRNVNADTCPMVFTIWGIQVDALDPKSDPKVSVVLMKFLRAKDLDVDSAQKMLVNTLRWRKEVGIDRFGDEDFGKPPKNNAGPFGHDKEGLPVIYTKASHIDWDQFSQDKYLALHRHIRAMEYLFRNILNFENISQVVKVIDLKDALSKTIPTEVGAELQNLNQNHYPDHTAYTIAINLPQAYVLTTTWVSRFGKWLESFSDAPPSPPAKNNTTQVGTDKIAISQALLARIDAKQLPRELDGEAEGFSWPISERMKNVLAATKR